MHKHAADAFAYGIEQCFEHRKRFALVFLLGLLLGVATQVNTLAQRVESGDVLTPRGIEHLQQNMTAETGPGIVTDQIFLGLFDLGSGFEKLVEQVFIGGVVARFEHALHVDVNAPIVFELSEQAVEIPLFFHRFSRHASTEEIREVTVAQILDHFAHVGALKNFVTQTIDFATLVVLNVVELKQLLANIVVAAFDLTLGALDHAREHLALNGHAFFELEAIGDGAHTIAAEDAQQLIFHRQIEHGTTRVTLTAGTSAQLIVDTA